MDGPRGERHGIEGRVAVVTGAARGIGREVAEGLLSAGCRLVALDRSWQPTGVSHEDPAATRRALERAGAVTAAVDVTSDGDVRRAYTDALDSFGTIDILVNNAAMRMRDINPGRYTEVLDTTVDEWHHMLDVNVVGPVRMIKQFSVAMQRQRSGVIVNVSSGSGDRGMPGDNPYGASKAALTNLSQSLAVELAPLGIAVSILYPWITRTTGYDEQNELHPRPDTPAALPVLRPDSVVPVVRWIAEQGMAVTGQTFAVPEWLLAHGHGPLEQWRADAETPTLQRAASSTC